ncbi:MAG TPA: hypothetical protein VF828_01855 [Patescibacteria group bacterium]
MRSILKSRLFWPVLLFLAIIPTFTFLLRPGMYWNMHDDMQIIRQLEFEKCLKDGQIPCRWTPDLGYGYGYPLFNFYPPLPYVVGQFYRIVGYSFMDSVKMTAVTQIILAAFFMYILASSLFGPAGGFLSAIFYTYAPYHAVNIYVRGAMNEAWSLVFFPIIFYFSKKLIDKPNPLSLVGLSLSFAGLFLSHNPMVLTFTPILFVWCLYCFFTKLKKNNLKNILNEKTTFFYLILSGLLSLSLTAFFTIPVLFESKYVQIETMFENYYYYTVHFVSFYQLFISNFWGDGPSVWGPNDGMSFMVGYLHWLTPLILVAVFTFKSLKSRKIDKTLLLPFILALMGFFTAFMTHQKSYLIWEIFKPIQKIQFPWRFLNHTAFLMSLSAGAVVLFFKKLSKPVNSTIAVIVVAIAVIVLNVNYFHPVHSGPLTDQQKFSGKAWNNLVTSGIYDYLPKTAKIAPQTAAKPFIDDVTPLQDYQITGQKQGTDWMFFNVKLSKNAKLTISSLVFPKLEIKDNFRTISYQTEPELGRPVIDLSSGEHQIYLKYKNTPVRSISNAVSLLAWIVVTLYLFISLWKQSILKKSN